MRKRCQLINVGVDRCRNRSSTSYRFDQLTGRTWEKFSSLPAKKPRKFEKKTFSQIEEGRTSSY